VLPAEDCPLPAPRQRRSPEEARALILDAAERTFAAHGPDAVGLKDVAREAGVSHALVSHYFGTFEKLVDAVLERRAGKIRAQLLAAIEGEPGELKPGDLLARFWSALDDPASLRLVTWGLLSGRGGEAEELFPARVKGLRLVADAVEARLAQRAGRGTAPPREDVEFIVMAAVALSYGYALMKKPLYLALGRSPTAAAQSDFRARVAALVEQYVTRAPRSRSGL
jgi:AcrR family transcriptional regulator